jgi:hypothetical protein
MESAVDTQSLLAHSYELVLGADAEVRDWSVNAAAGQVELTLSKS